MFNERSFPFSQDCNGDLPYQRTALTATASWGGEGLDTLSDIDVTPLVSFILEDEAVVLIEGSEAQGVSVGGPVRVSMQPHGALQASAEACPSPHLAEMAQRQDQPLPVKRVLNEPFCRT